MSNTVQLVQEQDRILSVDFFRGFTMLLLVGEFSELFTSLIDPAFKGTAIYFIGNQLHHQAWSGLHFWDLIQPFFMFIVGVAMPFSFNKRWDKGESWNKSLYHVVKRSLLLLFIGWALYCIEPGTITFHFTNVLAQLSVTYLIAFLIMRKAIKWQLLVSFALILATDLLYRFWTVDGFNQAFTPGKNFGTWFDMAVQGSLNGDNWVAFNAIPTAAHTIWGVLVGMILLNGWSKPKKVKILLLIGVSAVIIGFALSAYIPIIKRICTSSFIIVSGGWAIIGMAVSYWLIDVLMVRKSLLIFTVVGMNPLFIYLFAHIGGNRLLEGVFIPFTTALFSWNGMLTVHIATSLMVWFSLWYVCYFLYKRKIFIKL